MSVMIPHCGKASCRGFTLLELIVVITIIGIIAAVAIPSTGKLISSMQAKGAANQLAQDLLTAKERAMSRGHQVGMVFASSGNYLTATTVYITDSVRAISQQRYESGRLGLRPMNAPTSRPPDGLPAGAPAGGIEFAGNQVVFTPQGAGNPGAIYIFSSDGKVQLAVTVNLNGRVRTWQWGNGTWY